MDRDGSQDSASSSRRRRRGWVGFAPFDQDDGWVCSETCMFLIMINPARVKTLMIMMMMMMVIIRPAIISTSS